MSNKIKHLEMIQGVINRMAGNSFLLKGWCVTLVSALFALAAKDSNTNFILVAYYPVLMFWILDAYFLRQERLFRKKYDEVRHSAEGSINFSMNTSTVKDSVKPWLRVAFSKTLFLFYGTMLIAILLAIFIVV
ncbi:MAG: hypothetical protein QNJ55_11310 [Xenococcus sp. MO_188.B8]|nr:hypothetical protein [Xenococcus sp. MO_188.B8]